MIFVTAAPTASRGFGFSLASTAFIVQLFPLHYAHDIWGVGRVVIARQDPHYIYCSRSFLRACPILQYYRKKPKENTTKGRERGESKSTKLVRRKREQQHEEARDKDL